MFQGTASDVGKSFITAAFCRIFRQDGWRVAPFKSQNMSNLCEPTADGGLISRSQWIQAVAAGAIPTVHMNPIILRPFTDQESEVIIWGRSLGRKSFSDYRENLYYRSKEAIQQSLAHLRSMYDLIVLEGAGSPAEANLRHRELVNMQVAAWAGAPVIIVADIHRGGALAAIVGTMELLAPMERDRVAGFVINKFQGDRQLLLPGCRVVEERTGRPVLGIVPQVDIDFTNNDGLEINLEKVANAVRESVDMDHIYSLLGQ